MSSSGSSDLDLATCSNVGRRARFDPALDSRGEPTSGTYSNRVRWQIPQFATFVSFPRGPVSLKPGWTRVLPEDFPPEALTEKRQGTAKIEIGVSPTGTVSDCKLLQSSGHSDIDDASCKIATQRAMFGAALDVTGQTTAGRVQTDLNWRLPIDGSQAVGLPIDGAQDARPRPTLDFLPKAGTSELTFIVGKDGTLSDCNAQQSEGMVKGDPAMLCKIGVKQKPYTDADGQPVARRVRVKTSVVLDEVQ